MRGGIVGYQLPQLAPRRLPVSQGDTLVLATDGIRHGFRAEVNARDPQVIADAVLANWSKTTDDACVAVSRGRWRCAMRPDPKRTQLEHEYTTALRDAIGGAGEMALAHAYELGRVAAANGVGVVDLVSIHQTRGPAGARRDRAARRDWPVRHRGAVAVRDDPSRIPRGQRAARVCVSRARVVQLLGVTRSAGAAANDSAHSRRRSPTTSGSSSTTRRGPPASRARRRRADERSDRRAPRALAHQPRSDRPPQDRHVRDGERDRRRASPARCHAQARSRYHAGSRSRPTAACCGSCWRT